MHRLLPLLVLALPACNLPSDLGDCPSGSTVGWADVSPVFEAHCTECHSSERTGSARQDAPASIDYDTVDAAGSGAALTWWQISDGSMPPDGGLDRDDALLIREWLACGGLE